MSWRGCAAVGKQANCVEEKLLKKLQFVFCGMAVIDHGGLNPKHLVSRATKGWKIFYFISEINGAWRVLMTIPLIFVSLIFKYVNIYEMTVIVPLKRTFTTFQVFTYLHPHQADQRLFFTLTFHFASQWHFHHFNLFLGLFQTLASFILFPMSRWVCKLSISPLFVFTQRKTQAKHLRHSKPGENGQMCNKSKCRRKVLHSFRC